MNLTCAVNAAAKSDIAQVMVCMHATINDNYCYLHSGTKVRKLHTSRRDAFKSVNSLPYAKVWYAENPGQIEYLRSDFNRRNGGRLGVDSKINPNVALVYTYPGIKPEFMDSLHQFDGVVIAGTGLGQVPTNPSGDKLANSILPSIKNLIGSGIHVVIAPQTIFGRLNMNVYTTGRMLNEAGVIGNGCDWTPETALVKLMWVLGHTKEPKRVKEMMMKNYSGEISEITEVE
jgi:glutamyl-tRNA(Gln) amidotransferase subunit D